MTQDDPDMDEEVVAAVRRLGGIASLSDLVALGLGRGRVRYAVTLGALSQPARGLYVVPELDLKDPQVRNRLALTHFGPDAALTGHSAAAVLELSRPSNLVHLSVPHNTRRRLAGVRAHRTRHFSVIRHAGWPISPVRTTLIVLAAGPDPDALRYPALSAVQRRMITRDEFSDESDVPPGRLSTWRIVAEEAQAGAESGPEGRFWRLCLENGLPEPLLNSPVRVAGHTYRIDALWPDHRLGVEIDGYEFHGGRTAFEADRRRQNELLLAGLVLLRFPAARVVNQPGDVLHEVRAALAQRGVTS